MPLALVDPRYKEQQAENESLSNKYLGLYDENDKLQEKFVQMQYKIQQSTQVSIQLLLIDDHDVE